MKIKGITILILMLSFIFINNVYSWYSKDPAVFDKLKGTAWEINYHYSLMDIIDEIGFYDIASINSDGEACLFTWNLDGWPGMALYGDLLIGTGYGFTIILADKLPTAIKIKCFMFNIDGNSLSGDFVYWNRLTDNIQTSKLLGHKIGDILQEDKQDPPENINTKGLFETTLTDQNTSDIDPVIITKNKDNDNNFGCFIETIKEINP